MPHPEPEWIVLADSRRARLCRGVAVAGGRWYFEEATRLEGREDRLERGRPAALARPAGVSGYALADRRREAAEETRRFAREVCTWLDEHVGMKEIEQVHVFAPPRFLGHLRSAMPGSLRPRVIEHREDLSHLAAAQLARHASVRAIIASRVEVGAAGV